MKRTVRQQWDAAAAGWNEQGPQIRDWLCRATDAMLEMAGIRPGHHVLDVAAGAGDQTLDIAARVGPTGRVLATDISPGILAHASQNAAQAGLKNVETLVADAENLGLQEAQFDAAICRLGLMLLPDPASGLREIARVLKPGGGFCAMVFAGPETNPCVSILMSTALRHAGLPARDPWAPGSLLSLGRAGMMDDLLRGAGFQDVATTQITAPFRLPTTQAYLAFVRNSAAPVHQVLSGLDENARNAAWIDMENQLHFFEGKDGWVGPNELLLTAGRR
jgi:hypothetical protein